MMLLESTKSVLQHQEWQFQTLENATLRVDVDGSVASWIMLLQCLEEVEQIIMYSICSNHPSKNKIAVIQEFLTRANFGLRIGNFEFDLDDGEIRFKTSIQFAGTIDVEPMIERCLRINIMTMEQYLPGILEVMFTDIAPDVAIARIENPPAPATLTSGD